MYKVLEAFMQ